MKSTTKTRKTPLEISSSEFKKLGYQLVDEIAELLETIADRKVTPAERPKEIREHLKKFQFSENGEDPAIILRESLDLLKNHSLLTGHPRFWGFIVGSGAPISVLADFLASAINPNLGGYVLSPMATEMEAQTVRWLSQFVGYPKNAGGILTSGGNMANMVGFWAARKARADNDIRREGAERTMAVYVSKETHTWVQKAADLSGIGTNAIRWIPVDRDGRMSLDDLRSTIADDKKSGALPFLLVANAGSVSTGAIDRINEMVHICKEHDLWLHADGAYGGVAALLPEASEDLKAIRHADSIAIDPHKWLYVPVEAGCTLVKNPNHLPDTFSYRPEYYRYREDEDDFQIDYYAYGPQNSRGFRALKVWMALRQAGRKGYEQMIREDIQLTEALFKNLGNYDELEAIGHNLSICTFRYVPKELKGKEGENKEYLNELNEKLLIRIQESGEAFISNAVIQGTFALRTCIVNHRTSLEDVEALPEIVVRHGRQLLK